MARIIVLGGTGYAGRHIVAEAVSRDHAVVAISRSTPADPVAGAAYVQGSALDPASLTEAFTGADAVVSALSPRGDMEDRVLEALTNVVGLLDGTETRLGVVGGAGGSLVAPGGPRLFDQDFPEEYKHEAQVGIDSLALLEHTPESLD
ncbi:NAD(P)-dependent oxidoreductase, partial [Xanthomonas oryzae]